LKKSEIEASFKDSKIVVCKRNAVGQIYAAKGFRDMVHFSVGSEGKLQLCKFFRSNGVQFYELRGYKNDMPAPDWFHVVSMPTNEVECESTFLTVMQSKIKELGSAFIPHLMKVSFSKPSHK
jgi:hypothetical protein